MPQLLLTLPDQHDHQDPTVERNERRLRAWAKELPLFNVVECTPQVQSRLSDFNAQRMPGKERVRLLEVFREAVEALFTAFDPRRLQQLPLTEEERDAVCESILALFAGVAEGYKLVLVEAHRAGRGPAKDKLALLATFRAMEQITLGLLFSYRVYGPTPPFAFLETHQLYLLAEQAGVAERPVVGGHGASTIGTLYKRVMLLTIGDPYRLEENVALLLFEHLRDYAPLAVIGPAGAEACHGRFLVDLGSDSPPHRCTEERLSEVEEPRLLDLQPVAAALEAHLASQPDSAAARLLARVVAQIRGDEQRSLPRRAASREVLLACGVGAICSLLQGGNPPEGTWQVVNESANGYMLARTPPLGGELRVGDLAAVLERGEEQPQIAVIRWIRNARGGRVETGVEILPGAPSPVRCQRLDLDLTADCIFLPEVQALGITVSLIAPKGLYAIDQPLELTAPNRRLLIRAGTLLMETTCFDRFELAR